MSVPDRYASFEPDDSAPKQDGDLLHALGAVPDYPGDVLPAAAHALVKAGAADGLPPALLGGAALAALAAAVGAAAHLEVTPRWHERAILWVPLIAPAGAGKSPAQELAFGPIRTHDGQLPDDAVPVLRGDMTLEALVRILKKSDGTAALDVDELATFIRGIGEYKRGGGDELLGGEGDGMRPRWLPHLSQISHVDSLAATGAHPPDWQGLVGGQLLPIRAENRSWKLSESGHAAFEKHRRRWKQQAREAESPSVSAALFKADTHLARIALVFSEADSPGQGGAVDGGVVERAAVLVEFTLDCWRALPDQGSLGLSVRDAKLDDGVEKLRLWLEDHGGRSNRREIQRARAAGVRTGSDLDALLRRYADTYPGCVDEIDPQRGGIATVEVRAPARRPPTTPVSPRGDTDGSSQPSPHEHKDRDAVATGDTGSGDTEIGDTAPETEPGCSHHSFWVARDGNRYCVVCRPPAFPTEVVA